MTKETNAGRRRILRGALTASAAAAAVVVGGSEAWAARTREPALKLRKPLQVQPRQIKRFNFRHSRFRGRAARVSPMDNVDVLINRIAKQTGLPAQKVHQVMSMAYPSVEQFVLRKYAANPQALNRNLKLAGAGSPVAIVAPV